MRTKNELIKYLFGKGYIDLDEALELASGPKVDVSEQELMYEGAQRGQQVSKEANLQKFISTIVDKTYETDPDTGENILISFDVEKCADIMKHIDHKWLDRESTPESIREYLRDNIRRCIKEFITQHKENGEKYWSIDGGGYRIEAWYSDDEEKEITVEVLYTPERCEASIKKEDIV